MPANMNREVDHMVHFSQLSYGDAYTQTVTQQGLYVSSQEFSAGKSVFLYADL